MNWIPLTDKHQLDELVKESQSKTVAIFKHSTRCSVSAMVKRSLERDWKADQLPIYYLDLIAYRSLSNEIANRFSVRHESPQLILIKNGEAIYDASHEGIDFNNMLKAA
jgi:bacillithiol system protein YtxJ